MTYRIPLFLLLVLLGTLHLHACTVDFRFRPCYPGDDCGTDRLGRTLTCACDGICRPLCGTKTGCDDGEICIAFYCHGKDEVEIKLGQPCQLDDTAPSCNTVWRCREEALSCEPDTDTPPPEEVCNNKDDDCNGFIDDGLVSECSNICGKGVIQCKAGKWLPCSAPPEKRPCTTICGTGVQYCYNGIQGRCHAVDARPCGSDTGTCHRGIELCQFGKWTGICKGNTGPTSEICDNQDNDCNGQIDDGITFP